MAEYLTNNTDLKKVADAIREKGGTSEQLIYPDGFAAAIGEITTGVELSLIVSVTSGSVVTAMKGATVISGTSVNGSCTLIVPEAGTWSVQATLNGQTSNTASVAVVDSYAVALTFFSATITVTVDSGASVVLKKGSTTIATKTSTGTAVFTVTETGTYTVEATKSGLTVSGTVNVVSGTTSYALTLNFISTTLNDNSWAVIHSVSGIGENYWAVGDCKAVTVNGTVGTLAVNGTYYAYIIGFNHNGATGIDFGTFKTALSGGVDICLIDAGYDKSYTDGTKYFNMNHSSATNTGGWNGCNLRYDVLGSTSTNDGDATATTATNPVAGTLMAALPSDLRAVMQPMTIYTDNTGGGTNTAANVTASVDYLPLLAEYEVFGTRSRANSYEQNHQAQYAYYSAGNSKVKYRHSDTSAVSFWWERSPLSDFNSGFCSVHVNGAAASGSSWNSSGVAPVFRV